MFRVMRIVVLALALLLPPALARAQCDYDATRSLTAAYGVNMALQSLDLYTPRGVRDEPLILFVHGGGWIVGDKSQYAPLGMAFARCGVAFAALNYRLAPDVDVHDQADDIAAALHWLRVAAPSEGFSAQRVFLMGHSAGAELAAFTATSAGALATAALTKGDVAGVIAVDGAAYNPTLDALAAGKGGDLRLDELVFGTNIALWKQYDIGRNLAGNEPPFLVVHARRDSVVSDQQPLALVDELKAAGDRVAYLQPDRDHMTVLGEMMDVPDDPVRVAITRFVATGSLASL